MDSPCKPSPFQGDYCMYHQRSVWKCLEDQRDLATELARCADAEVERAQQAHDKLVATYKIRNIVGDDICDLCGGEIVWPNHKPECEIGQVLAILNSGTSKSGGGSR